MVAGIHGCKMENLKGRSLLRGLSHEGWGSSRCLRCEYLPTPTHTGQPGSPEGPHLCKVSVGALRSLNLQNCDLHKPTSLPSDKCHMLCYSGEKRSQETVMEGKLLSCIWLRNDEEWLN